MSIGTNFREALERSWRRPNGLTLALRPLSWLYRALYKLRGLGYRLGVFASYRAPVPVLVIGNLTVGGTGKTPLVVHIINLLQQNGYTPGVISRGYGGKSPGYPLLVNHTTPVHYSGDEPALIVGRTLVDMVVGSDRKASIESLLKINPEIDIIVSDDGLQHLALQRDIEVCVMDATSPQTNQCLLPAGPYRESIARLDSVDIVVEHGLADDINRSEGADKELSRFAMNLRPQAPKLVASLSRLDQINSLDDSDSQEFNASLNIHAVAGIGNPQRFFDTCEALGYSLTKHAFADHHVYQKHEVVFADEPVLMTEKDAVKCQDFADQRHWFLPVDATLSDEFNTELLARVASVSKQ